MKTTVSRTKISMWAIALSVLVAAWGPAAAAQPGTQKDIVDTAVAAGSFKTLAAALQAAGLVDTLKGNGPFTVFAPTDAAFAKLPAGTLESLLKPENKAKLTAILTYHVVPGRILEPRLSEMKSAPTVNGTPLTIQSQKGTLTVGGAQVAKSDIVCSNGVIYVIDSVLLPN